jgi:hypothetical protein
MMIVQFVMKNEDWMKSYLIFQIANNPFALITAIITFTTAK